MGRDVSRVAAALKAAGVQKCSDSLLYQWANPNRPEARPSHYAFLLLIKVCEDCGPIDAIGEACGKICGPEDDYRELIKVCTTEFEKRERMKGKP